MPDPLAPLLARALALGAAEVPGWTAAERARVEGLPPADPAADRAAIAAGEDPLGEAFCAARTPAERRPRGATYTPPELVGAMVAWSAQGPPPARVVDPGAGSGRFLVAAGRAHPGAALVAVEQDPVAAVLCRGHLAAAGLAHRAVVRCADYRTLSLPRIDGPTVFLGNPPYVRHHDLTPAGKAWLTERAAALGLRASQLSGLHVHFFLATAALARPGDRGAFVTSAEWLDTGYGQLVRELLRGPLGLQHLHVLAPEALPFADAMTTAVVTAFAPGQQPALVGIDRVTQLTALTVRRRVDRAALAAPRWSPLTRPRVDRPAGCVALGELCRVHRGQVTGANKVWVVGPDHPPVPAWALHPAVTRARELFEAGAVLADLAHLRRVIDVPPDRAEEVAALLAWARERGAADGYIARHRRAWFSVGLKAPAPILATYMARRPPAFVRNPRGARHLNIAHGLYPRVPLDDRQLDALAAHLRASTSVDQGRTYAGGLTKFEPREMERLWVPPPEQLTAAAP